MEIFNASVDFTCDHSMVSTLHRTFRRTGAKTPMPLASSASTPMTTVEMIGAT
jgi:hypothetical protein